MSPIIGDCLPTGIHDLYIWLSIGISLAVLLGLVAWLLGSRRKLVMELYQQQARESRQLSASQQEPLL